MIVQTLSVFNLGALYPFIGLGGCLLLGPRDITLDWLDGIVTLSK
jgi:hypothetical protein